MHSIRLSMNFTTIVLSLFLLGSMMARSEDAAKWSLYYLKSIGATKESIETAKRRILQMPKDKLVIGAIDLDGNLWILVDQPPEKAVGLKIGEEFKDLGFLEVMFSRAFGVVPEKASGGVWLNSVTICEIRRSNQRWYMVPGNYSGDVVAVKMNSDLLIALPPKTYLFFEKTTQKKRSGKTLHDEQEDPSEIKGVPRGKPK